MKELSEQSFEKDLEIKYIPKSIPLVKSPPIFVPAVPKKQNKKTPVKKSSYETEIIPMKQPIILIPRSSPKKQEKKLAKN